MIFLRKLKLVYPSTPQHYNICSAPTFLILLEKLSAQTPFKHLTQPPFYMRDFKVETIKLLPFYMTDFLFTEV